MNIQSGCCFGWRGYLKSLEVSKLKKEKDTRKVMVVSDTTWGMMQDRLTDDALLSSDPIAHLSKFSGFEIIIDNTLPFNYVEVYERWMYEEVLKHGKEQGG